MTTTAARYQFHIRLPSDWVCVEVGQLREALALALGASVGLVRERLEAIEGALDTEPDLLALANIPYSADGESAAGALNASMVVYTYPSNSIPDDYESVLGYGQVDNLDYGGGDIRSTAYYSGLVRSEDGEKVAVVTFSTPDVELGPELAEGFKSLIEGATLEKKA